MDVRVRLGRGVTGLTKKVEKSIMTVLVLERRKTMARASDFDKKTKDKLERRVNSRCSNPSCRRSTSAANTSSDGALNIGEAAHICAASQGGPRFDPSMSEDERKSISNGIWLCATCHKIVDDDPKRFPPTLLHQWKQEAEEESRRNLAIPISGGKKYHLLQEKPKLRKALLVSAVAILLILLISGTLFRRASMKMEYDAYDKSAYGEFARRNYDKAEELYRLAEGAAYDKRSELEAIYHQGMCYLLRGSASPQIDATNLHTALNIYLKIIDNFDDSDSQYYIDAITDSCLVYYLLGYSASDMNWTALVQRLEERYDPTDLEAVGDLPIELVEKIAVECAHYYDKVSEDEFRNGILSKSYQKSMIYYGYAYELGIMQNENVYQNAFDGEEVLLFLKEYTNRLLNYDCLGYLCHDMGTKEQAKESAEEVIALCEAALNSGLVTIGSYENMYLETLIGKTYRLLAQVEEEQYAMYAEKAYERLMPLVDQQISSHYTEGIYTDSAYYALQTLCCKEADYQKIVCLFEMAFKQAEEDGYTGYLIELMRSACGASSIVIKFADPPEAFVEFARNTARELEEKWPAELTAGDWEFLEIIHGA